MAAQATAGVVTDLPPKGLSRAGGGRRGLCSGAQARAQAIFLVPHPSEPLPQLLSELRTHGHGHFWAQQLQAPSGREPSEAQGPLSLGEEHQRHLQESRWRLGSKSGSCGEGPTYRCCFSREKG